VLFGTNPQSELFEVAKAFAKDAKTLVLRAVDAIFEGESVKEGLRARIAKCD